MGIPIRLVTMLGAGALLIPAVRAEEEEHAVAFPDLPEAVQRAFTAMVHDPQAAEIEMETEDGETTYEAEWTRDGFAYSFEVAPSGAILEYEMKALGRHHGEHEEGEEREAVEHERGGREHEGPEAGEHRRAERRRDGREARENEHGEHEGHEHAEMNRGEGHEQHESAEHESAGHEAREQGQTPGGGCDCSGTHQPACTCHGEAHPVCGCHH